MRLAEYVEGTVDVDGMLSRMTQSQFNEWVAKDRIEPIGQEATRQALAILGVTVAQLGGCKKEPELRWFMPWLKRARERVTTWAQVMERKAL